ncbi:MAG: hypothetical protein Q8O10_10000 [candidate division Zixibacteria bacterium]|nr:hypothetical protein [candidate division Zixibacteria bacterium]
MSWFSTSGPSSAHQFLGNTAHFVLLPDITSNIQPSFRQIKPKELDEKREKSSLAKIRVSPENTETVFYLLLRTDFVECLPESTFITKYASLEILKDSNISYELVELSASV